VPRRAYVFDIFRARFKFFPQVCCDKRTHHEVNRMLNINITYIRYILYIIYDISDTYIALDGGGGRPRVLHRFGDALLRRQ